MSSVAVKNGLIAVSVIAPDKTDNGHVVILDANGAVLNSVEVGANPDQLTFTPDGSRILVANEGEMAALPTGDNPVGSVSVISLAAGVANATVQTAG